MLPSNNKFISKGNIIRVVILMIILYFTFMSIYSMVHYSHSFKLSTIGSGNTRNPRGKVIDKLTPEQIFKRGVTDIGGTDNAANKNGVVHLGEPEQQQQQQQQQEEHEHEKMMVMTDQKRRDPMIATAGADHNEEHEKQMEAESSSSLSNTGTRRNRTEEIQYILVTISKRHYTKFLNVGLPCIRTSKQFRNYVILLFGLGLDLEQVNTLQNLHMVHFVPIPIFKFFPEQLEELDKVMWSNIVKKLSHRFSDVFANEDAIFLDALLDLFPTCPFLKEDSTQLLDNNDSMQSSFNEDGVTAAAASASALEHKRGAFSLERKRFGLVIPFIQNQVENVVEQLHRWSMTKYAPCSSDHMPRNKFDLIFYYHREMNETLQEYLLSQMIPQTMLCFNKIVFRYAQLLPSEDKYPIAANYMFYRLVHDVNIYTTYRYIFYAEPDSWAIRNDWMNVLEKISYDAPEQFWVKGSIYRGPRRDLGRLSVNIHINGNAIYSLTDDYLLFLYRVQSSMPLDAYDVAQTRLLFRDPNSLRAYWHKFAFSEFIQNLWQVEWSENEVRTNSLETIFVHGKKRSKEPLEKIQKQEQQQ
jgi:hypothetical protein